MRTETGKLHPRNISKVYHSNISTVLEYILLFGLGALAITLHAKMRIPMKIPGHHGVEFMALLMLGRMYSGKSLAATISGLGVAAFAFLPWLGFRDPFMPLVFFIPTILLDLGYRFLNFAGRKNILLFALLAGLAHFFIPLARTLIMAFTGYPYGSLKTGLLYPYSTYLLFGFIGGLLGAGIYKAIKGSIK